MSRTLKIALPLAVVTGLLLWLATPARLQPAHGAIELPEDLDAWIAAGEKTVDERYGLIHGTQKRIRWFSDRTPTRYAVLYFHGFSATRQETAPLAELVADALGANLFETRLSGHGREREGLTNVRAEDWLRDAAEALAIAQQLGEDTIIIGTSTGATLAAAMLAEPAMQSVDTIVMLSPNFAPRDDNAAWLTRPAGPLLAEMMVGETRSWEPHNEAQGRYWTTSYPMSATVEMMRLVDLANRRLPATIGQRLLLLYSPDDAVISSDAAVAVYEATAAPQKALLEIRNPGDPSHHVLAGDVLSADKTEQLAAQIVEFISRPGS